MSVDGPTESGPTRSPKPRYARVGDQLGRYRLEALLGEGAVGSVFRAVHVDLGRKVAIKVVNPELHDRSDILRRFFNEARAVNRIRHENIVDISDIHDVRDGDTEQPFLVMELLEGWSLTRDIRRRAPMAPERAVAIVDQMCGALAAVHAVQIIHRDLKTDNVFLIGDEERPRVKLLDFGVSKFLAADEAALTRPGELMGTPQIMAPEQIRGKGVDARTDVYAVGILLFEMLAGRHPFETTDLVEMLSLQMSSTPPRPSEALQEAGQQEAAEALPPALDELVVQCLAKDPATRVQDMTALRDAMQGALRGEAPPAPARPRLRPTWWPWATAGAALCVAAVLAIALWPRGKGSPAPAHPATSAPHHRTVEQGHALRSVPTGASVYRLRDGRYLGVTPLQLVLPPGETVLLRKDGYQDQPASLSKVDRGPLTVHLTRLVPRRPREPAMDRPREPAMDRPVLHRGWPRHVDPRRVPPRVDARRTPPRDGARGTPMRPMSGDTSIVDPFREQ